MDEFPGSTGWPFLLRGASSSKLPLLTEGRDSSAHLIDVLLEETEPMIRRLAEKLWSASRKEARLPRTVMLKLKTSDFRILTRSYTPLVVPSFCEELTQMAVKLRERVELDAQQRYRLVGIGLSNFREAEQSADQPALFE